MAKSYFKYNNYESFSGCDIVVTARMSKIVDSKVVEKTYTLGALQTLSISTHQDRKPVRSLGNQNAIDYTLGQRTIAGSLVFAVFNRHFAHEMFEDLQSTAGKQVILVDDLPPLDITVTFANEYGYNARMALYGVKIVNEGQVMSINDIFTENTYQYVATGLEPLSPGQTLGSSSNKNRTPTITSNLNKNNNVNKRGSSIVESLNDNNIDVVEQQIRLTVEIENPTEGNVKGLAKFKLNPNQKLGYIYINNIITEKVEKIDVSAFYNSNLIYTDLEQGTYTAQYKSENNLKTSNIVSFQISILKTKNLERNDKPIIERISDDTIEITSNNPLHTHVRYYSPKSRSINTLPLAFKKATISNLDSNTKYVIQTFNEYNNTSKLTIAKTFSYEKEDLDLFIDFIKYNKNILLEEITKYEIYFSKIEESSLYSIIDIILSFEVNNITQELLFYAIKFQNQLNLSYNSLQDMIVPKKVISYPFWNNLLHDNTAVQSNYFYVKDKKEYYDSSVIYPTTYEFLGIPNRRYYSYDIDNSNSRGVRCDFCCFNDDYKSYLNKYKNTNVISTLNIDNYKHTYPNLTSDSLYNVAVKEYKVPNINILKAPICSFNEEENLIVDVNYIELLYLKEKEFYLCISDIKEALDTTPIRKVKFYGDIKTLNINKYVSGIINNTTYLIWIEDENFNIISKSFIFSTNNEDADIQYINEIEISSLLAKSKSHLINLFGTYTELIESIYLYVQSLNPSNKILNETLEQELINYGVLTINLDDILYELIKYNHDKTKDISNNVIYDKQNNTISFDSNVDCYIANYNYCYNNELPFKNVFNKNTTVQLNKDNMYSLFYLIDDTLIFKSGFILINNITKKYYTYNLNVEVIE